MTYAFSIIPKQLPRAVPSPQLGSVDSWGLELPFTPSENSWPLCALFLYVLVGLPLCLGEEMGGCPRSILVEPVSYLGESLNPKCFIVVVLKPDGPSLSPSYVPHLGMFCSPACASLLTYKMGQWQYLPVRSLQ